MSLTQNAHNEMNGFTKKCPVTEVLKETDDYRNKKRKINSDSFESLIKQSINSNLQSFLYETGLSAQLIDKNDRKLIKLNPNKKSGASQCDLSSSSNEVSIISNNSLPEFDDLPSLSDISSGTTLALPKITKHGSFVDSLKMNISKVSSSLKAFPQKSQSLIDNENECVILDSLNKSQTPKKSRLFICNECGKQFHNQSEIGKHLLHIHRSEKHFEISHSAMNFNDLSAKKRNEKEHTDLNQFRCFICALEFTRASHLRAHILKLHKNEIGKSVVIFNTEVNKLKFKFNIDEINKYKERMRQTTEPSSKTEGELNPNLNNNAVIYIKDPSNKNAKIQHMVVYVDGKPVFVKKNPPRQSTLESSNAGINIKKLKTLLNNKASSSEQHEVQIEQLRKGSIQSRSAKIPYSLEAAASKPSLNNRYQSLSSQNNHKNLTYKSLPIAPKEISLKAINVAKTNSTIDLKQDQEYMQLVSLLRQKNEKLLFNPQIINKNY